MKELQIVFLPEIKRIDFIRESEDITKAYLDPYFKFKCRLYIKLESTQN